MPTYSYAVHRVRQPLRHRAGLHRRRADHVRASAPGGCASSSTPSGVVFKGSGFYRTDSRESARSRRVRPTGPRRATRGRAKYRHPARSPAPARARSRVSQLEREVESSKLDSVDGRREHVEPDGYPQPALSGRAPDVQRCAYRCARGEPSLNPSLFSRISTWLRPDWTRTVLARRVAAGGLVVLAGVATLRSNPDGDYAQVVVADRDLRPASG